MHISCGGLLVGNTPLNVLFKQYYIMMTLCPGLIKFLDQYHTTYHVSQDEACAQQAQPLFSNHHINHLKLLQTELSSPYL